MLWVIHPKRTSSTQVCSCRSPARCERQLRAPSNDGPRCDVSVMTQATSSTTCRRSSTAVPTRRATCSGRPRRRRRRRTGWSDGRWQPSHLVERNIKIAAWLRPSYAPQLAVPRSRLFAAANSVSFRWPEVRRAAKRSNWPRRLSEVAGASPEFPTGAAGDDIRAMSSGSPERFARSMATELTPSACVGLAPFSINSAQASMCPRWTAY